MAGASDFGTWLAEIRGHLQRREVRQALEALERHPACRKTVTELYPLQADLFRSEGRLFDEAILLQEWWQQVPSQRAEVAARLSRSYQDLGLEPLAVWWRNSGKAWVRPAVPDEARRRSTDNLAWFRERFPGMAREVETLPEEAKPCLLWDREGRGHAFHGNPAAPSWVEAFSDPGKRGEKLVAQALDHGRQPNTALLISGLGTGYGVRALLQATEGPGYPRPPVFLLEPSAVAWWIGFHLQERTACWNHPRIFLFPGLAAGEDFQRFLATEGQARCPEMSVVIAPLPTGFFSRVNEGLRATIVEVSGRTNALEARVKDYYRGKGPSFWARRFEEGAPPLRILGITDRFSTFIQYAMRDLIAGFQDLGCRAEMAIQAHDTFGLTDRFLLGKFHDLQPDLVVMINRHRLEQPPFFPRELPFALWLQDYNPQLCNPALPAGDRQGELDYYFLLAPRWKLNLVRSGLPASRIFLLPLAVNEKLYQPGGSDGGYRHDLGFVGHLTTDPQEFLAGSPREREMWQGWYRELREDLPDPGHLEDYWRIFLGARERWGVRDLSPGDESRLFQRFSFGMGQHLQRVVPLTWVADMGLTLYGRGWERCPELAPLSRGPLANGAELSSCFRATRINLHLPFIGNLHQRIFEVLGSGGFCLVRRHAEDGEPGGLAEKFDFHRELAVFSGREEMRRKIRHYLEHPGEREEIARQGRERVLREHTFTHRARAILEQIRQTLRKQV